MANGNTPAELLAIAQANLSLAEARNEAAQAGREENEVIAAKLALDEQVLETMKAVEAAGGKLTESDKRRRVALIQQTDALKDREKELEKAKQLQKKLIEQGKEVFNVVKDVALAYDTQRAALAKLFPATSKYNTELAAVMRTGGEARLTFAEAAAGFQDLAKNFIGFSEVSSEARKNLATLAGGFKAMDIPNFSENLNMATFAMGMNAKAAGQLQLDLIGTEKALQLPAGTIMKEFLPAMEKLTQYTNDEAIKVFKALAAQSKATGIAIGDLMGIVGKFDTFQGAAEAAGKFNAMLGGDFLNSMQLLNATEEERIQIIKSGFDASGRAFSDLTRFEKQAVATSLGLKSVAQAQKLLGTESENLKIMEERAKKAGMSVEEFTKAQEASKKIGDKLTVLYQKFPPLLSDVVDVLSKGVGMLTKFADSMGGGTRAVLGLVAAFAGLKIGFAVIGGLMAKFAGGGILSMLFGGITATAGLGALKVMAVIIGLITASLIGIGTGMAVAGAGFKVFAESMKAIQDLDYKKILNNTYQLTKMKIPSSAVVTKATQGVKTGLSNAVPSGGSQTINLVITHNDVEKTTGSIKDSLKKMNLKIGNIEKKVGRVQTAK